MLVFNKTGTLCRECRLKNTVLESYKKGFMQMVLENYNQNRIRDALRIISVVPRWPITNLENHIFCVTHNVHNRDEESTQTNRSSFEDRTQTTGHLMHVAIID
jgi:hypothetical protein